MIRKKFWYPREFTIVIRGQMQDKLAGASWLECGGSHVIEPAPGAYGSRRYISETLIRSAPPPGEEQSSGNM